MPFSNRQGPNLGFMFEGLQDSFNPLGGPAWSDVNGPCTEGFPMASSFLQDKQYTCSPLQFNSVSEPWFNLPMNPCGVNQSAVPYDSLEVDYGESLRPSATRLKDPKSYPRLTDSSLYDSTDQLIYQQFPSVGYSTLLPECDTRQQTCSKQQQLPQNWYPGGSGPGLDSVFYGLSDQRPDLIEERADALLSKADFTRWRGGPPVLSNNDVRTILESRPPSSASDSDIIVEESEESQISISDVVGDGVGVAAPVRGCLVCGSCGSWAVVDHLVSGASQTPVETRLVSLLPEDLRADLRLQGLALCPRCLALIAEEETLHIRLMQIRDTLLQALLRLVTHSEVLGSCLQYDCNNETVGQQRNTRMVVQNSHSLVLEGHENNSGSLVTGQQNNGLIIENQQSNSVSGRANDSTDLDIESHMGTGNLPHCDTDNMVLGNRQNIETVETCIQNHDEIPGKECDEENIDVVFVVEEQSIEQESAEKLGQTNTTVVNIDPNQDPTIPKTKEGVSDNSMTCKQCGKVFDNKTNFERHERKHSERFQCEKCGQIYRQKYKLNDHLLRHSGSFKFKCSECGKEFIKASYLKTHLRLHFKDSDKARTCEVCGKNFRHPSDLADHMKVHSNLKPYKCGSCDKAYKSSARLKKHMKADHSTPEQTKQQSSQTTVHSCTFCPKKFKQGRLLRRHVERMHKKNPSVVQKECPVCNKNITHCMSVHMRTHTGEKPFTCSKCNLSFTVGSSLNKHMKTQHPPD